MATPKKKGGIEVGFKRLFKLSVLPGGKENTAKKPAQADLNKDISTSEEDDSNAVSGTVKSNDCANSNLNTVQRSNENTF